MHYIIFDLEFNQDFSSLQYRDNQKSRCPFEIIQIGAVKLDMHFNTLATFDRYVKPTLYTQINPFITELTGITTHQLVSEETFPEVYKSYTEFIGDREAVFCVWGMSDMKELFRNVQYHQLSTSPLPRHFINLQPYTSIHFKLPSKKLLRLQDAVSILHIPISIPFHNALADAYYTTEIFKKIYHPLMQPNYYDPHLTVPRTKQQKKQIDTEALIKQFAKMYGRDMSKEEQNMIKLAYQMGKTRQFLK